MSRLILLLITMTGSALAGSLNNFVMQVSDVNAGALASYTFSYQIETALTTGDLIFYPAFPGGFSTESGCASVTVTVDDVNMPCYSSSGGGQYKTVSIRTPVPAGANVVVVIDKVTNTSSAGVNTFRQLITADSGGREIDKVATPVSVTTDAINNVPVFNNQSENWQDVTTAGLSEQAVTSSSLVFDDTGRAYLAYVDNNSQARVMTLAADAGSNGQWQSLSTLGFPTEAVASTSLVLDSNGLPYLAYIDLDNNNQVKVLGYAEISEEVFGWATIGDTSALTDKNYVTLAINPWDQLVLGYSAFADGHQASVMQFYNEQWNTLPVAGFSTGIASYPNLVVDDNADAYVTFSDADNVDKTSVKVLNANTGQWEVIGSPGFSAGASAYSSISLAPYGSFLVAYQDGEKNNAVSLMYFDEEGDFWSSINTDILSADPASYTSVALDDNNIPYLAYSAGDNGGVLKLKKLAPTLSFSANEGQKSVAGISATDDDGDSLTYTLGTGYDNALFAVDPASGALSFIADPEYQSGTNNVYQVTVIVSDGNSETSISALIEVLYVPNNAPVFNGTFTNGNWHSLSDSQLSPGQAASTSLSQDSSGRPYIAYQDQTNANKVTVKRFEDGAWQTLGQDGISAGAAYYLSLSLANNDIPHIAFFDAANSSKATVMQYVEASDSWQLLGSAGFTEDSINYLSLAFDSNNTPYITYVDGSSMEVRVMNFDGSNWQYVGSSGVPGFDSRDPVIAFDGSDIPYVAYIDGGNSYRASVRKFDPASDSWLAVGEPVSATSASTVALAIDKNDLLYLAYEDNTLDGKVTVKSFTNDSWQVIGSEGFSAAATALAMALDTENTPYLAFSGNDKTGVMRFQGQQWQAVGQGDVATANAADLSLVIADSGQPYLAYIDNDDSLAKVTTLTRAPAFELSEGSTRVGVIGASDADNDTLSYSLVANDSDDSSYFTLDASSGELNFVTAPTFKQPSDQDGDNHYQFTVLASDGVDQVSALVSVTVTQTPNRAPTFDGPADAASWQVLGGTALSTSFIGGPSVAVDNHGILYAAYIDYGDEQSVTVHKYSQGRWEIVGDLTLTNISNIELAINADNIPYLAYIGSDAKASVLKFSDDNWQSIGADSFSSEVFGYMSFAVDNNDTPYIAYKDNEQSKKATVMSFTDNSWQLVGDAGFSTGESTDISLAIDHNGIPYVAYRDHAYDNKATVMHFNGDSWQLVGSAGFSTGRVSFTSLVIDSQNIPYAAYTDMEHEGKATVMAFIEDSWQAVGNSGFTEYSAGMTTLAIDDSDHLYLAFTDEGYESKGTVMKFAANAAQPSWQLVSGAGFTSKYADYMDATVSGQGIPYYIFADYENDYKATVMSLLSNFTFEHTEGKKLITTIKASDADNDALTYTLVANDHDDSSHFALGETTGELSFVSVPDFAQASDQDGDNRYQFSLMVSDGIEQVLSEVTVSVVEAADVVIPPTPEPEPTPEPTPEPEPEPEPTPEPEPEPEPENTAPVLSGQSLSLEEDSSKVITLAGSDAEGDNLTYSLAGGPAQGELFASSANGQQWTYIPADDYSGTDSFSIIASDGELSSPAATISLTISPVNDAPIALDDEISLDVTAQGRYSLNVLANDSDIDGDNLRLLTATASRGEVGIADDMLTYQQAVVGPDNITIEYLIDDGNQGTAKASVHLTITGDSNDQLPVITLPADIEVNATGLFTKVNLGVATAVDARGDQVPVSLVDGITLFEPGEHQISWQATDNNGNTSIASQKLTVFPLISISKDKSISEGSAQQIQVILNGPAPVYPLTVPYTVSGSSDNLDHNLTSGEVVITQGTLGYIDLETYADELVEGNETLIISLAGSLNLGSKAVHTTTIGENNIAPEVSVTVTQGAEQRLLIVNNNEAVSLTANVSDANVTDSHSYLWQDENALVDEQTSESVEISPADLSPGIYKISLKVTDSGSGALSTRTDVYLEIITELAVLTDIDSDGDLIPDNIEGYGDDDNDGIPDYLDNINECNVLPEQLSDASGYLVEGEPGVCLRTGATLANNQTGGAQLSSEDIATVLTADSEADNIGGLFDFIAYGLPTPGQTYAVVFPQRLPIPANAIYRKYNAENGWVNFIEDSNNRLSSAPGEPGYCPPPGDEGWSSGLTEGHWCVQVSIEDGGPNDDDQIANGTVVDPGGVAVLTTDNNLPLAVSEQVTLSWNNSISIDVLANDSDLDGDHLTITAASVDFGAVTVMDNQLVYDSAENFSGVATIDYSISDNNGGTAHAQVSITVIANTAPVAINDSANTNDLTAITVDVLANDSDIDGDSLAITSAQASSGDVAIVENKLVYTPQAGFYGQATIHYQIDDGQDSASGTVTVEVSQSVVVDNKSSGGSVNALILMLASLVLFTRRFSFTLGHKTKTLTKSALLLGLLSLSCQSNAQDDVFEQSPWLLEAELGYSKAKRQGHTDLISQDNSDTSWSFGLGYKYAHNWQITARYIDLGEAEAQLQTQTLTPELYHQTVAEVTPALAHGFAVDINYLLIQQGKFNVATTIGVMDWETDRQSSLSSADGTLSQIKHKDTGTDLYYGIEARYNLNAQWQLGLGAKRYNLDINDVDSLNLLVKYHF